MTVRLFGQSLMAHALMDNRHGLVSDFRLTEANGMAERDAALDMLMRIPCGRPLSVGADRGYDTRDFVAECRELNITPHVARKERWSAIDGRTTRHAAYRSSQKVRKRVESIFGWMKTVGGFRRSRYVGLERTGLCGELVATAYNLARKGGGQSAVDGLCGVFNGAPVHAAPSESLPHLSDSANQLPLRRSRAVSRGNFGKMFANATSAIRDFSLRNLPTPTEQAGRPTWGRMFS